VNLIDLSEEVFSSHQYSPADSSMMKNPKGFFIFVKVLKNLPPKVKSVKILDGELRLLKT